MENDVPNLFRLPCGENEEIVPLLEGIGFRFEAIISNGQASASDFWYDQPRPEWVLLVAGQARLDFESGEVCMIAGDFLTIPAGCRHRVSFASQDARWLALHFTPGGTPELAAGEGHARETIGSGHVFRGGH